MARTTVFSLLRIGLFSGLVAAGLAVWAQEAMPGEAPTNTTPAVTAPAPANEPLDQIYYFDPAARGYSTRIKAVDTPQVKLNFSGKLAKVDAGKLGEWDYTKVDPAGFGAAMGFGTTGRAEETGDLVAFSGRAFVKTAGDVPTVVDASKGFQSPFIVSMNAADVTNKLYPRVYRLRATQPRSLAVVIDQLVNTIGGPIAILGWVEMPAVDAVSMKQAPISGENIWAEKRAAYQQAAPADAANMVFFALANPVKPKMSISTYLYSQEIFDFAPAEGSTSAFHLHGALVKEATPEIYLTSPIIAQEMRNTTVTDVVHMDSTTPGTTIQRGAFLIYRVKLPVK